MTDKIYKVQLLVDVYFRDPNNIVELEKDNNNAVASMQDAVLNIVDYAEEEGLLQPACEELELMTWHSVVSDPTANFVDELPVFSKKEINNE